MDDTQQKKGLPAGGDPCHLAREAGQEGRKINTHEAACLFHGSDFSQQPRLPLPTDWATRPPAPLPTSPGIPLDNIARFLSLRLFSFSIENAKYLEGIGEVSNLKEIIY